MTPNIISKPAFKVLGYSIRTSINDGSNHQEIPAFWQRYISEGLGKNIPNELKLNPGVQLGVCLEFNPETNELTYLIGFETTENADVSNPDLTMGTIPAATYAVFTTPHATEETFSKSVQETWHAAFRDWFPESGYEHGGTPEFEWYDERSDHPTEKQMDIYIPIKQR